MHFKFFSNKKTRIYAGLSLVAFVILGGLGAITLKDLKTVYSVMQFVPTHHPALIQDTAVRDKFKLVDHPTFVGLVELPSSGADWLDTQKMAELSAFSQKIEKFTGVIAVIDIANVQGAADLNKSIVVGKISDLTPVSGWRRRFLHDQLLSPTLLSNDSKTAMVYVQLEEYNVELLASFEAQFREALSQSFPGCKTTVGGVPAVQTDVGILLNQELRNFILLTLLACALTLFMIFRTFSSMWVPLILTAFSNIMVFAMMSLTGLAFTVLSSTIPILVFIAVVSITVHVMLRISEDAEKAHEEGLTLTKWQLILNANKAVALPNLLGALTTCVGFLTLLTSDVPMIREYGIGVSAAIMISWAFTSLGILPLLSLMPLPVPRVWVQRPARWALWVIGNRKWIVASIVAVTLVALFYGQNLYWTARLFDDLPENQEARQSSETIDHSMGGIVPMEMSIELPAKNDWNEPKRISALEDLLIQLRKIPAVGTAISLPDFLKASGLSGPKLPTTRGQVAEIYFLYSFSSNNPVSAYMTPDARSARVEMKLHDIDADKAQESAKQIKEMAEKAFPDAKIQAAGLGAVMHIINHEISSDLIFGFWQALLIILVLLAIVFKSIRWSIVAALPNLIPPILLLGYLVLTHTPIKPSVAIIFSIALGLAFNNTVYVLNRLRSLLREGSPLPVQKTFYVEGNPCLVSTLVVMLGFSVFLFSYFSLNRVFGACMMVAIIAGLLGDLVFLPALLQLFPGLLHPRKNSSNKN